MHFRRYASVLINAFIRDFTPGMLAAVYKRSQMLLEELNEHSVFVALRLAGGTQLVLAGVVRQKLCGLTDPA